MEKLDLSKASFVIAEGKKVLVKGNVICKGEITCFDIASKETGVSLSSTFKKEELDNITFDAVFNGDININSNLVISKGAILIAKSIIGYSL